MSFQALTASVQQYTAQVMMLLQQSEARSENAVQVRPFYGKAASVVGQNRIEVPPCFGVEMPALFAVNHRFCVCAGTWFDPRHTGFVRTPRGPASPEEWHAWR